MYVKNSLHTDIVRKSTNNFQPNCVLGSKPPPIHKSERSLPCITRRTLSQLRSGHCARLRDFQFRIGKSDDDQCTLCNINSSHSISHPFDCPARPTTLTTKDLCENPRDVADHLRSMPVFDNIPAPTTPPPPYTASCSSSRFSSLLSDLASAFTCSPSMHSTSYASDSPSFSIFIERKIFATPSLLINSS